jgi:dolichol-phosphate mannosyltransferase
MGCLDENGMSNSPLSNTTPVYSFVIPIYNEEQTLAELQRRLMLLLDRLDGPAEVILVDDGSDDRTPELLTAIRAQDPRFKLVRLSRNYGHQVAITAGMDAAAGAAVIIMDADLQDPPEVVTEMIARWREGYEVVYAVREAREGENLFKRATAAAFYRVLRRLTDIDIPADVGDFRLVDRKAMTAFMRLREHHRFVRGLFSWIGFRQTGVRYRREPRFAGVPKYSLRKMLKLAGDGIVSFSHLPLRLVLVLGFFLFLLAMGAGVVASAAALLGVYEPSVWQTILWVILGLFGLNFLAVGTVGVYVGRIYEEVKRRPIYIAQSLEGIAPREAPPLAVWPHVDGQKEKIESKTSAD